MPSLNRSRVTFLIDGSGSMDQGYSGGTRWTAALQRVRELALHLPADTPVDLVTFGNGVEPWFSYPSAKELLEKWQEDVAPRALPGGGSRIWDCLGRTVEQFIDEHPHLRRLHIILLTDGEDRDSVRYRDEATVRDRIALASGRIELTVLYFGSDAKEEQRLREIIRDVGGEAFGHPDDDVINGIGRRLAEAIVPAPLRILVPVIPLLADPAAGEIEGIQDLSDEAIAFLESLTGLRYYPVPTLLVPEHLVRSVRRVITVDPPDLDIPDQRELRHIATVLGSFCLDFHVGNVGLPCRGEPRCSGCELPVCQENRNLFELIRGACEGVVSRAILWLEGKRGDRDLDYMAGLADGFFHGCRDYPNFLERQLQYVTRVFTEIARYRPDVRIRSMFLTDERRDVNAGTWLDDWLTRNPPPRRGRGACPAGGCPDPEGGYTPHTLAHVFRRLTPILIQGMRRTLLAGYFITEISPYGVYVPTSSRDSDGQIREQLAANGLPERMALSRCGRVLLCQDTIARFVSGLENEGVQGGERRSLAGRFLQSILVHEHMHAVLAEGVDTEAGGSSAGVDSDAWQGASALNESLAEWAELHFFRGDPRMRELVLDHARAGRYPAWPYAGALKVEEIYARRGLEGVRQVIRDFRAHPAVAMEFFDRGEYLRSAGVQVKP